MNISIRSALPDDAAACGHIMFDAFRTIADTHNFPPDFPSAGIATGIISSMIAHPRIYGAVAEIDGKIVGSNFLDERSSVAGLGPITVDPGVQNRSIGRFLMEDVMSRADTRKAAGVRLLQVAYHNRSLSLYTKLGFEAREMISTIQGAPINKPIEGYDIRPATMDDMDACCEICRKVHGHDRGGELHDAIQQGTAVVVEHKGKLSGYTTLIAFFGHAVAMDNDALKAMISMAGEFPGPGFLVPTRNTELLRWCFENGFKLIQQMTLMTRGFYQEPIGAYLPSVLY